jgi:hypothetical protein
MRTIQTCPKCTAEFEVVHVKVPSRDGDIFECQCRHTLMSWSGSRFLTYRLTRPGVEQLSSSRDAVSETTTA